MEPAAIRTPITETMGVRRGARSPSCVPVLRAGVWMVEAFLDLIEDAEVGMIGMARDEETLRPTTYVDRLPAIVTGDRPVFVLDPMLATGGSACAVAAALEARGVRSTAIRLLQRRWLGELGERLGHLERHHAARRRSHCAGSPRSSAAVAPLPRQHGMAAVLPRLAVVRRVTPAAGRREQQTVWTLVNRNEYDVSGRQIGAVARTACTTTTSTTAWN